MAGIKITGGIPLSGEVKIQGSKNAALPMMAAALLNKGVTVLHGCPKIADVFVMEEILKKLGVKVIWEGHTLLLDAEQVTGYEVDRKLGCQMRSSIVLLGSLLGRCGQACVPYPGGCVIGKRPVDLHLAALEAMGAEFQEGEMLCARAGKRQESRYHFPKSSVGAAQNAILAAVCAPGITWLSGCSKEPEVSWLCRFLNQAGARIEGVGSQQLKITGVRNLHDTEFQVPADRIAAGTYVCAAAITRGNCILDQAPVEEMGALLAAYEKIGGQYTCNSGKLILSGQKADGFIRRPPCIRGFPRICSLCFWQCLQPPEEKAVLWRPCLKTALNRCTSCREWEQIFLYAKTAPGFGEAFFWEIRFGLRNCGEARRWCWRAWPPGERLMWRTAITLSGAMKISAEIWRYWERRFSKTKGEVYE